MADYRKAGASALRKRQNAAAYYSEGNAARVPDYDYEYGKTQVKKVAPVYQYEKREAALGLKYTLFLTVALCIAITVCFLYMKTNTRLNNVKSEISSLQTELSEIQEKNDSLKESLNTNMDLNELYQKASDLGMVYPDEDQIIYYDSSNGDYIRQFNSIPDDE